MEHVRDNRGQKALQAQPHDLHSLPLIAILKVTAQYFRRRRLLGTRKGEIPNRPGPDRGWQSNRKGCTVYQLGGQWWGYAFGGHLSCFLAFD